ncbi:MAG: calcium binding hemolysin protein [Planctomycetota bacterium]|nr:MAG: calcium binding hemolysin protein [Planctomycetota bacterium]
MTRVVIATYGGNDYVKETGHVNFDEPFSYEINTGPGNDEVHADHDRGTLIGGPGTDLYHYPQSFSGPGGIINLLTGTYRDKITLDGIPIVGGTLAEFENVRGGEGADLNVGDEGNNVLDGQGFHDDLVGLGGEMTCCLEENSERTC